MGLFNMIRSYKEVKRYREYAKMMNGSTPIFSQFGENIYASDIVQNAIRCIQDDMSKLAPKHIRTDPNTGLQNVVNDEITKLLKFGPNSLMTTSDFISKIIYQLEVEKNVYVYPTFEKVMIDDKNYKRKYTGFWPLNPSLVEYLEDEKGELYIRFYFNDGQPYIFKYADIIHIRKDFGANDFNGGDIEGRPNNKALLKLLKINDVALQGIDKGIKSSLSVRGVTKVQTLMEDEEQEEKRKQFEEKMKNSDSGILAIDLKSDFIPINMNPKIIDKDTMEFIDKRILSNYGVALKIFNGDFTEEDYQAYYEKTLEPKIIAIGRAFTKALFTQRELDVGNEVIFYQQGLMYMNTSNKIAATDILTRLGTLMDNEVLNIFGYPPFEGGNVRRMSLNYINRDIADQYQLQKTKPGGKGDIVE